ncbi:MAG: MbcA/ParS/Xre antitoxin family protein [Planctomycetia bacterium]|nr:MbcA/ParS/Xre antitoxin family protein [Planctomycetia bacterium]
MAQTIIATGRENQAQHRATLAKMLMKAFELWNVPNEDQLALLGLALENRAALSRYRRGEPLAANRDLLERAGHLLAIHKNLRLLFPHDRDLAYRWMTTRNRAFGNQTPVEVICEWGFAGLLMVRSYLDRARGS